MRLVKLSVIKNKKYFHLYPNMPTNYLKIYLKHAPFLIGVVRKNSFKAIRPGKF